MRFPAVFGLSMICLVACSAVAAEPVSASLPQEDGRTLVARVNGEPVLLDDVFDAVAATHEADSDSHGGTGHADPGELLERLINSKLIVQEARTIGLDELPECRSAVSNYRALLLRGILFSDSLSAVLTPDRGGVDRKYRDAVEEVRLRALFISDENDARDFTASRGRGREFDELADEFVAAGKALEGSSEQFMRAAVLFPEVREALVGMENGDITTVLDVGRGWAVVKLLESRVPEDPAQRKKAEEDALQEERQMAIRRFADELKDRYARIDREILDGIDLESETPGLEALLEDERVVAKVKGADPVTVAELTAAVKQRFFHGPSRAAEKGVLNEKIGEVLDGILDKRVVVIEAERLELEKTAEYRRSMGEFEGGFLFALFVRKVIEPDLRVEEADLRAYMQEHIDEFTFPAMVRLESLVFSGRGDAESALEKLRQGADLAWIRLNASGQLSPAEDETLFNFGGKLILRSALPQPVVDALSGARPGEFRFAAQEDGPYYVLSVREIVPERTRPLEDVRSDLTARVLTEERQTAVEAYASQVREASEIEIYARGETLRRVILDDLGAAGD